MESVSSFVKGIVRVILTSFYGINLVKRVISKISVDSNFAFTRYAWFICINAWFCASTLFHDYCVKLSVASMRLYAKYCSHFIRKWFLLNSFGVASCLQLIIPITQVSFNLRRSSGQSRRDLIKLPAGYLCLNYLDCRGLYRNAYKCDPLSQNEHKVATVAVWNYYRFKFFIIQALKWYMSCGWWWYWEVPSMQIRIITFIPLLSTLLDVR